jgi:fascin 1/2
MSRRPSNGGSGSPGALQWKIGLVNHLSKYLTAESFGFKINAAGTNLRKKQMWTIEQDPYEDDTVYIRSHLGMYLAGDKKGVATCSSEEKGDAEKFVIQYHPDGSGRWAIGNRTTGYYLGGTDEIVQCYEKQPTASEWWTVHLAIHPQVNLRNVNRQKYARLDEVTSHIQVTEVIPWGQDSLITLEFRDGGYCVKPCDNRYLHRDGSLVDQPSNDTLFTLEIKSGQWSGLALRDCTGKYLTAVGKDAVMLGRNKTIGKDELFLIEDSQPQCFFTAHNGKMASIKQGIDVTANQDELSDKETFQIEFEKRTNNWRIRTEENKYWSLEQASGIQAVGDGNTPSGLFSVEFLPGGAVALKASNGRYLTARMNGSLYAVSDSVSDKERFFVTIVNRPILVLKCEFGFVGFRTSNNPRYECNKSFYDVIYVQHTNGESGVYFLIGHNGKYWSVDGEGNLNADSASPQPFIMELRGQSKMAIRAPNGNYIKGEQNGIMSAKSPDLQKATMWEY